MMPPTVDELPTAIKTVKIISIQACPEPSVTLHLRIKTFLKDGDVA